MKVILSTFISLALLACASSTTEQTSNVKDDDDVIGKQSISSLVHLVRYANTIEDHAAENFIMESVKYENTIDAEPLTSGRSIKKALAECAFEDAGYSTPTRSYKAAHIIWKLIRDEVTAGTVKVYRDDGQIRTPYEVTHRYDESCNVAGAPCTILFQTSRNHELSALAITGDTCQ